MTVFLIFFNSFIMLDKDSSLDIEQLSHTDSEEIEGGAGTEQDTDNGEGELSEFDDSILDDEAIKERERQKTLESHIKKAKELQAEGKDLPESLKYVSKYLEAEQKEEKKEKSEPKVDRDSLKQELLAEMREEAKFEEAKKELQGLKANKTKWIELEDEFKDLVSSGMPKSKALAKAIKLSGIKQDAPTPKKQGFNMPEQGQSAKAVDVDNLSDDEFLKWSAEMAEKSKSR